MNINAYLGLQFNPSGDSASEGFNCFTFMRHVRKSLFGKDTPVVGDNYMGESSEDCQRGILANRQLYESVRSPKDGDIVVCGDGVHVGIYIDGGCLHCMRGGIHKAGSSFNTLAVIERLYGKINFIRER